MAGAPWHCLHHTEELPLVAICYVHLIQWLVRWQAQYVTCIVTVRRLWYRYVSMNRKVSFWFELGIKNFVLFTNALLFKRNFVIKVLQMTLICCAFHWAKWTMSLNHSVSVLSGLLLFSNKIHTHKVQVTNFTMDSLHE